MSISSPGDSDGQRGNSATAGHTGVDELSDVQRALHESEARSRSALERLQLATRAGGVGVWELDFHDHRFIWDEQMHALYGLRPGEFVGTLDAWAAVLHPDDVGGVLEAWTRAVADVATFEREFRIRRPSGEWRYMRAVAQVIGGPDGRAARALGTNWDVTAAREAAAAMHAAKEAAEAARHAKGEFLAIMSHEIRGPMNAVLGMIQLVLQTDLTPKQYSYLTKAELSARTLVVILDDILDFSKIEARKLRLEETEFALDAVLESLAAVTAVDAEEKGLAVAISVAPGVPDRLIGDPLRLGQVLINLVSNAVKFTRHGEVFVSLDLDGPIDIAARLATLRVAVRDTGIGLDPAQLDRLFEAFTQGDSHISREYGGTGLGLAISKQLVEMMGGRIWATSERGRGSTFSFTVQTRMPSGVPEPPAPASGPSRGSSGLRGLRGRRVLVVDDSPLSSEVTIEFLLAAGIHADAAVNGRDALDRLRAGGLYDVILMDMQMPEMDGLTATREIRTDARWARLPIVALTAQAREADREASLAAGMNTHLTKPIDETSLYAALLQVLAIADADDAADGDASEAANGTRPTE